MGKQCASCRFPDEPVPSPDIKRRAVQRVRLDIGSYDGEAREYHEACAESTAVTIVKERCCLERSSHTPVEELGEPQIGRDSRANIFIVLVNPELL